MDWISVKNEILKDLAKAKNRLDQIDIEAAVLQKERSIISEKKWELELYLEKIEEANKPLPQPPKED